MNKIIGIGNALVDALAIMQDDALLEQLALPKGSMQLINRDKFYRIRDVASAYTTHRSPGGSASNMIRALATLGHSSGFIGKVGVDEAGEFYQSALHQKGIQSFLIKSDLPTGIASAFISPDGERTFATYLGAGATLQAEEIAESVYKGYDYFFVEGYLVQDHALIESALRTAKEQGLKVCLDLASYNIVEEDLPFFQYLVQNYVDIVFANESEAKAFTGKSPYKAIEEMAKICEIVVVKIGKRGSLIGRGGELIPIKAVDVPAQKVEDTTGAGDFYAAGFLHGLLQNVPLDICGNMGSLLSAKVIQYIGADLPGDEWQAVKCSLNTLIDEYK